MDSFFITFRHPGTKQIYRAKVEVTYQTDKIMRFKISAGDKSIIMAKHLYRKNNQWEDGVINFNPSMRSKEREIMIGDIRKEIDDHLSS